MAITHLLPPTPRRKPVKDQTAVKLPKDFDVERLCQVIIQDRKDLEPFRRNRRAAVAQTAGRNYSDSAVGVEVPVNLLGLYVQIMSRSLVANNPRVMLSTFDRDQSAAVNAAESWANDEIVALGAVETYKRAITDALYCIGVVKVALSTAVDSMKAAWNLPGGQPFMECIDLDDFVCDLNANRFDQCSYTGHRYRVPVELADELYAKGKAEKFQPEDIQDNNFGGDERITTLGHGGGNREEIEDHCDLWEIFLPRHKLIVTLRDDRGVPSSNNVVRVQRWIGPPCGPYHFLALGILPGNLMPKAPIMDLIDLHRHYNSAYRKLLRQTKDYKKVLPYRGGQTEEIKRLKDEQDGGMFQCDNAETVKELELGGPANSVLVMSDHMKTMFDFIGGNLSLLGGRSPQSKTASQDKMLSENASAGVADMQDAAVTFVQETMEAMLWYWWHHPTKVMQTTWSPPSLPGYKLNRQVGPGERKGKPPKMKVDPYSLPRQTPQSRLTFINQVLQTVAPMMAFFQEAGASLDPNKLLELFAKYGDEPDLPKLFQSADPPQPEQSGGGGSPDAPGKPANTTRTYERYSHGGEGPQAKQADLNAEMASMAGPANPNQG